MRRPSSTGLAAAAILALAGGLLAGCGGSGDLIPASRAADLRTELDAVKTAVDNGNCDAAGQAVARARGDVLNLPASVDQDLRARLQEGVDSLARLVPSECGSSGSSTQETKPSATQEQTDTSKTDTQGTDTSEKTTTTQTQTQTTPTQTQTQTQPTTPNTQSTPAPDTGGASPNSQGTP